MYADSSDMCNDIAFNLAGTVTAATKVTRSWTIKVKNTIVFVLRQIHNFNNEKFYFKCLFHR